MANVWLTTVQVMLCLSLMTNRIQSLSSYGSIGDGYGVQDDNYNLADMLLKDIVDKIEPDYNRNDDDYIRIEPKSSVVRHPQLHIGDLFRNRVAKDPEQSSNIGFGASAFGNKPREPSTRDQEYLQHSTLWGHQYVAGGAGEGTQRLKPDGSIKNPHEVKTDPVLPAYCNPPNPCPFGYTDDDGCITDFTNTAVFSREFQGDQECMCDTEHMFDCPALSRSSGRSRPHNHRASNPDKQIDTLAQSISNEGLNSDNIHELIKQVEDNRKNLVAKKHFIKQKKTNPYLVGEKLPVQAKKSPRLSQ